MESIINPFSNRNIQARLAINVLNDIRARGLVPTREYIINNYPNPYQGINIGRFASMVIAMKLWGSEYLDREPNYEYMKMLWGQQ